jgi:phospholipase/lecithinase/hemolysin
MKKILNLIYITQAFKFTGFKRASLIVTTTFLMLMHSVSHAAPITSFNVFGDSLSDSGAFGTLFGGAACPPAPYDGCRFSNGPVWAELVANKLGLAADTAYSGGTNWAIGGARSDEILGFQVGSYLASTGGVADSTGLYSIWGGANDNFQNVPAGTYDPNDAAQNIINSIVALAGAGATNFLIPNLPIADLWAFNFNTALSSGLAVLGSGLNIIQFDALGLFADVTTNPDTYGFTNVIDPCFNGVSVCSNPDEYSLWDSVHPTAAGHRIIASAVLDLIDVSTPSTIALFSLAFVVFLRARRTK